jgi:ATP diphosphatase
MKKDDRRLDCLGEAMQVQVEAKHLGFDWPEAMPVFDKVLEELDEVKEAFTLNDRAAQQDELGDLLFAVVNLCRHLEIPPSDALMQATDKFSHRFEIVKSLVAEREMNMQEVSIDQLEALWEEAKSSI